MDRAEYCKGARLFSVSSGVHELIVLLSIIVGGGMFGVWGMILAVPGVLIKIFIEFVSLKLKGLNRIHQGYREGLDRRNEEKEKWIENKKRKNEQIGR